LEEIDHGKRCQLFVVNYKRFAGVLSLIDLSLKNYQLAIQLIRSAQAKIAVLFKLSVRIITVVQAAYQPGAYANGEKMIWRFIARRCVNKRSSKE
jgi:hypothetical protein